MSQLPLFCHRELWKWNWQKGIQRNNPAQKDLCYCRVQKFIQASLTSRDLTIVYSLSTILRNTMVFFFSSFAIYWIFLPNGVLRLWSWSDMKVRHCKNCKIKEGEGCVRDTGRRQCKVGGKYHHTPEPVKMWTLFTLYKDFFLKEVTNYKANH